MTVKLVCDMGAFSGEFIAFCNQREHNQAKFLKNKKRATSVWAAIAWAS